VSFIRQYLTEEDCVELNLFSYSAKRGDGITVDEVSDDLGWEEVKKDLVKQVGGGSIPAVCVDDVNRDGTLILRHEHDGRDLELQHANRVVEHVKSLWGHPVKFFTVIEDETWEI
jgi:stage V sporulation protein R